MGDRKWLNINYRLEPPTYELFFQMTIGASGAPTLQFFDYKKGTYSAANTIPAGAFGTQGGSRGIKSVVRNSAGNYTINLQQTSTRFLQGQITFENASAAAAPLVIWPTPNANLRTSPAS